MPPRSVSMYPCLSDARSLKWGKDRVRHGPAAPGRHPPVVIFTEEHDETGVLEALAAGAAGYLLAHISSEERVAALRRAADSETVIDLGMGARSPPGSPAPAPHGPPTWYLRPRERQVLEPLRDGEPTGRSPGTSTRVKRTSKPIFVAPTTSSAPGTAHRPSPSPSENVTVDLVRLWVPACG
jgi:hypothetical protein